ncbi:MAG: hypothetical protein E7554_05375 [Ruminococcaceae bacterium]|nr:hypothetical protein [Oscillospiraceae bacterium]
MKSYKKFFAVLVAAALMIVCALPVFAESAASADAIHNSDYSAMRAQSFEIMGKGMLGIFIVMFIILLVIVLLNVITKPRKK